MKTDRHVVNGLRVKEYQVVELDGAYTISWRENESLSHGLRTQYPMHVRLITGLLNEAGYKDVSTE